MCAIQRKMRSTLSTSDNGVSHDTDDSIQRRTYLLALLISGHAPLRRFNDDLNVFLADELVGSIRNVRSTLY